MNRNTERIGLIAAIPQESKALLRCLKDWKRISLGRFQGIRFRLMDRDCLLVTSGMGVKRAMDSTRILLAAASPHLLISFGIGGAVKDDLHIGDVVVAGNNWLLDTGQLGVSRPLSSLSKAAWNAAAQILQLDGARLLAGTAITTRGSQTSLQSMEEMDNPILEMETAGIAQVAAERGIPLLSIRSVSDGPQAPIPFDLAAILDEKYNFRMSEVLKMVLRRPQIIFQSQQLMQNSRKAADHAARAVIAMLSQPSPVISP
jgi:adenosylhomocysteine nucleosidase